MLTYDGPWSREFQTNVTKSTQLRMTHSLLRYGRLIWSLPDHLLFTQLQNALETRSVA